MPCGPKIHRVILVIFLTAWAVALFDSHPASAQAPQSKFADVNGVKLHFLVAG